MKIYEVSLSIIELDVNQNHILNIPIYFILYHCYYIHQKYRQTNLHGPPLKITIVNIWIKYILIYNRIIRLRKGNSSKENGQQHDKGMPLFNYDPVVTYIIK